MKRPYYMQKQIQSNQFIDTGEMIIEIPYPYSKYDCFIAECYEADYWIWYMEK